MLRIEHPLPGVAAARWRPVASLSSEQGNLADVIAVVRDDLPEPGADCRLPRTIRDANVFDDALESGRVGICQGIQACQQFAKALLHCFPLRFGRRLGMLRPAFNCVFRIERLFPGDVGQVMIHPVIHVPHDLPDRVRIAGNSLRRQFRGLGVGLLPQVLGPRRVNMPGVRSGRPRVTLRSRRTAESSGSAPRRESRYTSSMTDMTTIKVSVQTRDRLKRLADEDHLTMDAELARTLDKAEEARFWEGVRADYARLQADPQEWADYGSELAEWDHAVADGLDEE